MKHCENGGCGLGHVTYFSNCWDLLISLERLKMQTSLVIKDLVYEAKAKAKDMKIFYGQGHGLGLLTSTKKQKI